MNLFLDAWPDCLEAQLEEFAQQLEGLPPAALDWSPGADMNSLAVLTVHTCGSTRFWLEEVCLGASPTRDRDSEFATRAMDAAALQARLRSCAAQSRAAVARITEADLAQLHQTPYRDEQVNVAWALLHILEHVGQHLGHAQLTRQLWQQRGR